jgi:hypothetical protein
LGTTILWAHVGKRILRASRAWERAVGVLVLAAVFWAAIRDPLTAAILKIY